MIFNVFYNRDGIILSSIDQSSDVALDIARLNVLNCEQDDLHRNNRWSIDIMELFWKFVPGTIITVPYPKKQWKLLHEMNDGSKTSAETYDPNEIYRPLLEKLVGRQHLAWDWRITGLKDPDVGYDQLEIKFRFDKSDMATYFALRWA